jgi:alkylhydroperoxidase family enzyme
MQTQSYQPISAPLLDPQAPAGEEQRVADIFNAIQERIGFIPDGLRLYSLSPPLLETFVGNVTYFNGGGTELSAELTAMIRYLVSWQSGCAFCVDMNEAVLVDKLGLELDQVRAARTNPELAPLADKDKALLRVALKAANNPEFVSQQDLDAARQQGWKDRDLFDTVVQAASMRAFNIVLRTFKVEHQGAFA